MKAIVYTQYGPPDVLRLTEVEKPVPKGDEVLVRVHATAVTSTDPVDRKGEPWIARFASGLMGPRHPIPGSVLAGEIESLGEGVKGYKVGDQVFGSTGIRLGAHAQYVCVPEGGALALKPANLTFEETAAICDGALTALPFLRDHARIQRGQNILINGASGSIGTVAVQLAKYYGAHVTGVSSTTNLEWVKSLGADEVIDYTSQDFTENGETYDVIFDAVSKRSFSTCKDSLKPGGIYLTTVPSLNILIQMLWTSRLAGKKAIFAATGLRPDADKAGDLDFIRELAEAGTVRPVIDRRYTLEQIADAHRHVEGGHKKGNVVITVGESR